MTHVSTHKQNLQKPGDINFFVDANNQDVR